MCDESLTHVSEDQFLMATWGTEFNLGEKTIVEVENTKTAFLEIILCVAKHSTTDNLRVDIVWDLEILKQMQM